VGSCIPVSKALRRFTPRGIRSYAGAQFAEDFECNRDLATITTLHVAKRLTADDLLHSGTDCLQSRGCPSHRWQASDFIGQSAAATCILVLIAGLYVRVQQLGQVRAVSDGGPVDPHD
jgi:hypothetical protein